MPDGSKLWAGTNLNKIATNRALSAIANTGRALPCSVIAVDGSIVRVKFEAQRTLDATTNPPKMLTLPPITLPKAESQWLRAPTQVGDFGITVPADTYLGGVSGLGGGVADLSLDYGNLTTLVWVPIGNTAFPATPNADQAWINGPEGVVISDAAQTIMLIIDKASGTIQMAGSGDTANDGMVRKSDLQAALNAFALTLQTWGAAHFNTGSSSPPAPTAPTATASDKTFSS